MSNKTTIKSTKKNTNGLGDKIIDDLLKTGFPLEVFTSNILNNNNWRVVSSPLYIDPDNKITRELDINALKIYKSSSYSKNNRTALFSHLIIQCKKSAKPWVFFDNAHKQYFWLGFYGIKSSADDFISKLCLHGEEIGFKHHRYKRVKLHRSFHVAFNEPNQTSLIYDALISVCKALYYYKNQYGGKDTVHFFTPIIVIDGTLWSASLRKNSKVSLRKANKLVVDFDYIFGDDKRPNKYENQLVEIITKNELKRSLLNIEKDNKELLKGWVNYLKK